MISLNSEITAKLLNYFYVNPHANLYINEISRKLKLDKRNLVKKLKELEKEGILKSYFRGNMKFYSINKSYPLYEEYGKIIKKTIGFEIKIKDVLKDVPGIEKTYIFGSYAKNKMDVHSDIDMLIVGKHDIINTQSKIGKLQKEINREINVVNLDEKEFKRKLKQKDPFILEIINGNNIKLI